MNKRKVLLSKEPIMIRKFLVLLFVMMMPVGAMAANFTWDNSIGDNLWGTDGNWDVSGIPATGDYAYVGILDLCKITTTTDELVRLTVQEGGTVDVNGGVLNSQQLYLGASGAGTFTLSSGSVYLSKPSSGGTRIGAGDVGTSGVLEIKGGTFSTLTISVPYDVNSTGLVKVTGGTLDIYGTGTSHVDIKEGIGGVDISGTGTMKWGGDKVSTIGYLFDDGKIFSSDMPVNKKFNPIYNSGADETSITATDYVDRAAVANIHWENNKGDNLWSNPNNWHLANAVPMDSENVYVSEAPGKCVINDANAVCLHQRIQPGGVLEIDGGVLASTGITYVGYEAGSTAEMRLINSAEYTTSTTSTPGTRIGYVTGSDGILYVGEGCKYTTNRIWVAYAGAGSGGLLNIDGGTVELTDDAGSSLYFKDPDTGSVEMSGGAKLIWKGDHEAQLNVFVSQGKIYANDPNVGFVTSYDGIKTTLSAYSYLQADIDEDFYVDGNDLSKFVGEWLVVDGKTLTNPNRLIFAPAISPITVDGSFGDWTDGSGWAVFGGWFPDGEGLASTTQAMYGWNETTDMLYIAIESTQPLADYLPIEIGGLMGDLSDPTALVKDGVQATQIRLEYNGSSFDITNSYAGVTTGVVVGHTWDGTTLRVEIATPIYSDWKNDSTDMQLTAGMDIYEFVNIFDDFWEYADSQSVDGVQVTYSDSKVMEVASAIRLLNSLPGTCADFPAGIRNYADFAGDCSVNFEDFAVFALDWLECNDPENVNCQ